MFGRRARTHQLIPPPCSCSLLQASGAAGPCPTTAAPPGFRARRQDFDAVLRRQLPPSAPGRRGFRARSDMRRAEPGRRLCLIDCAPDSAAVSSDQARFRSPHAYDTLETGSAARTSYARSGRPGTSGRQQESPPARLSLEYQLRCQPSLIDCSRAPICETCCTEVGTITALELTSAAGPAVSLQAGGRVSKTRRGGRPKSDTQRIPSAQQQHPVIRNRGRAVGGASPLMTCPYRGCKRAPPGKHGLEHLLCAGACPTSAVIPIRAAARQRRLRLPSSEPRNSAV